MRCIYLSCYCAYEDYYESVPYEPGWGGGASVFSLRYYHVVNKTSPGISRAVPGTGSLWSGWGAGAALRPGGWLRVSGECSPGPRLLTPPPSSRGQGDPPPQREEEIIPCTSPGFLFQNYVSTTGYCCRCGPSVAVSHPLLSPWRKVRPSLAALGSVRGQLDSGTGHGMPCAHRLRGCRQRMKLEPHTAPPAQCPQAQQPRGRAPH